MRRHHTWTVIPRSARPDILLASLLSLAWTSVPAQHRLDLPCPILAGEVRGLEPPDRFQGPWSRGELRWIVLAGPATIDPETGRFRAGAATVAELVRVGLGRRDRSRPLAEGLVLVLPWEPFAVVAKVLGPGWLEPFSAALPFADPEIGQRPAAGERVHAWRSDWGSRPVVAGYGIPVQIAWPPAASAQAQRLSYGRGEAAVRLDVPGAAERQISLRERVEHCDLEGLSGIGDGCWLSATRRIPVIVSGLLPVAGNSVAAPGHQDGLGLSARFQEPFGLARVATASRGRRQSAWLVTDAGSHVLRLVDEHGQARTLCGQPGKAGHRDSPGWWWTLLAWFGGPEPPGPLFNRPTHLAVRSMGGGDWLALVADSGNHCIRKVRPDGQAATWAGSPGQAGWEDASNPRSARFASPQGLALDPQGYLYVADQGNAVIRVVYPEGRVWTLAGEPGQRGSADGMGSAARFREPRGLALVTGPGDPRPDYLFIADGHALRRLRLSTREVRTVLGQVDAAGFRDCRQEALLERLAAMAEPCMNRPVGLEVFPDGLAISDQGNHSVRWLDLEEQRLTTLVGSPDRAGVRYGVLDHGLEGPLDSRFASLDSPRTLAAGGRGERSSLVVTTGACLGEVRPATRVSESLRVLDCRCAPATSNQSCLAHLRLETRSAAGEERFHRVQYEVDFLDPDGSLAEHRTGWGRAGEAITVVGHFNQAGDGTLVLRAVSEHGSPAGVRLTVPIR
jgi:hypothetical protein